MDDNNDSDSLSDDFDQPSKPRHQTTSKEGKQDSPQCTSRDDLSQDENGAAKADKETGSGPAFKCQHCSATFTFKSNCTRHERNCSANCGNVGSKVCCPNCNSIFSRHYNLKQHLTKCTTQAPKPSCSKKGTPCLIKGCDLVCYHKTTLIEHLQSHHANDVTIKPAVTKNFQTIQEFNEWKEKEEESTFSYYTLKKGQQPAKSAVKHFYCQHDGSSKVHSHRKTSRCNKKGRVKAGHFCISKMKVTVDETKAVEVVYYPTHNHVCKSEDFVHHPLPEKVSRFIDKKLAENIPPTVVYELTKELFLPKKNTPNVCDIKANILTKKRILERGRRRRMARRLHKDDARSVFLMVHKLLESEDASSVLLYKPAGSKVVHGPPDIDNLPDSKDLFLFGMQTDRQAKLLKEHCGKVVVVDETHGTNQYKYQLLTTLIVDENNRGWPVAHLITSRSDAATLKFFFQCLKDRMGEDGLVTCVITDDDPTLIKSMNHGFSEDLKHILCVWHVIKNFKDNLRSRVTKDLFDPMLSELRVIMNTTEESLFLKLIDGFQKKYETNPDASKFIDYFRKYYVNRVQKWALCYRNFPHGGVNTTGHVESFHHRLKKIYLKRKVNKRLDDLIDILYQLEWDDHCTRCRLSSTGVSASPQEILERHQRGLAMDDNTIIEQALNKHWEMKSAASNKLSYIVVQLRETCTADLCFSKCLKPECHNLCAHMFSCSCPDNHPLCKHIHKLQSFLTRGQPHVHLEEADFYVLPNHKAHSDLIIEEQESQSSQEDKSVPLHDKKWTSMTEELRSNVKLLEDFVSAATRKQVSENSLVHVHSIVSDLVKGIDTLSLNSDDIPEMRPCVKFAPNEKLKTQLSQLASFKRPMKRKRKSDPAELCQKKKAALESLLQYHGPDEMSTEDNVDDELDGNVDEIDCKHDIDESFTLHMSYVDDPTDIVLTCGEEKISLVHLKSLEVKLSIDEEKCFVKRDPAFKVGWLYSSVIDAFLYKISKMHDHVLYLSCNFALRASLGRSNATIILRKLNASCGNVSIILLPANLSGDHWIILVVLIEKKEICYYDPQSGPISQKCISLLKQTVSDMKEIFPKSSIWKVKVQNFHRQTDSLNCGPLVCSFAYHCANGSEKSTTFSPLEFRKFMYATIVGKCLQRSKFTEESCGKCGVSYMNDSTVKVWACCTQCQQWFHESCIPSFLNGPAEFVCP